MDAVDWIGAVASFCSVTSFVPQAWKAIRARNTRDVSAGMYAVSVVGFSLWTCYGVLLGRWPLIVTNSICLLLAGFILLLVLLPKREKEKISATLDPTTPG